MRAKTAALLRFCLRLGLSAALLAWLFSDTEPKALLRAAGAMDPAAAGLALALYLLSQVISSVRWRILARALGFGGRWLTYLGYYFVGMYFNLFLPTGVGGDLLKITYLTQGRPMRTMAAGSILMDRILGLAGMFTLGGCAALFFTRGLPAEMRHVLLLGGALGVLSPFLLPLLPRLVQMSHRSPGERLSSLLGLLSNRGAILSGYSLSVVLQALCMGAVAVLGQGMGIRVEPGFYYAAFPIVALAILLPVSFNGIGVREGGFILLLGLRGVPRESALTLSLAFFTVQVISSLMGGLAYAAGLHRRPLEA